jgi:hypothetical protein
VSPPNYKAVACFEKKQLKSRKLCKKKRIFS